MHVEHLLITLDPSGDRKEMIDNLIDIYPNTEIVEAVNGRDMDILNLDTLPFDQKVSIKTAHAHAFQSLTSPGAVGCYLSHVKCWKRCVELERPVIVFEDDFAISPKIAKSIEDALHNLPDDIMFGSLGYIPYPIHMSLKHDTWYPISDRQSGTMCYYITPSGARTLLQYAFPICGHVDEYIGLLSNHEDVDFKSYRLGRTLYPISSHFRQVSSIGHGVPIMGIVPNTNSFYIVMLIVFICMLIAIIVLSVMLLKK
jgi:glycosyl transferase family 25